MDSVILLLIIVGVWYILVYNSKNTVMTAKPAAPVVAAVPQTVDGRTGIWRAKDEYGYLYYPEKYNTSAGEKTRYAMRGAYCNRNKDTPECNAYKNVFCADDFNATNTGMCTNGNFLETFK